MPVFTSADDGDEEHHAVCPLCVTVSTKNTKQAATETAESHNEQRHDGDDVTCVAGPYREDLNALMDHVDENYDHDVYKDLGAHIVKVDPWDVR